MNLPAAAVAHYGNHAVEDLGFVAAFLTTAAFVPQLVRAVRLRTAHDISLPTFSDVLAGVLLWLLYGLFTGSKPIVASNALTLGLSVSILILKLRYDSEAMGKLKPGKRKP